MIKLLII